MQAMTIPTSAGNVAVTVSAGKGAPVLAIHGNSASQAAFNEQINSSWGRNYKLVTMDLPGHGASQDAVDPTDESYSIPWYSAVALEVMQQLDKQWQESGDVPVRQDWTVLGWSLGGHVAMGLLSEKLAGLILVGCPPVECSGAGMGRGFRPSTLPMELMFKPTLTTEEAAVFMGVAGFDPKKDPDMIEAAQRTAELARPNLMKSVIERSAGGDQKTAVELTNIPILVLAGANDTVNIDYLRHEVKWNNLKNIVVIPNGNHSILRNNSEECNAAIEEFLDSVYA